MKKPSRQRLLLEKGYFPEELPPAFSSVALARHCGWVSKQFGSAKRPSSLPETYSLARAGHRRRTLSIPNPVNQMEVVNEIAINWADIRAFLKDSKISLTVPKIKDGANRAAVIPQLSILEERRLHLLCAYPYALACDISRFYPTLYTHAIPWALHRKQLAKRDRSPKLLGNRLDAAVRRGQDDQTVGIPIGPDTSLIIAEIIAVRIEKDLRALTKKAIKDGHRYIDDFFLCFATPAEAHAALHYLRSVLKRYELETNDEKTRIFETSSYREPSWTCSIQSLNCNGEGRAQRTAIFRYFSDCWDLAQRYADENVMKYAIGRSSGFCIKRKNWHVYESFLLRAARSYTNTVDAVVKILIKYKSRGRGIDRNKLSRFISDIILHHGPLGHHSEVVWVLWLAKVLRLEIERRAAKCLGSMPSSVVALLTLDLRESGLIKRGLDTSEWRSALTARGLYDSLWLLSYEADLKCWLKPPRPGYIEQDQFFRHLKAKGISFYEYREHDEELDWSSEDLYSFRWGYHDDIADGIADFKEVANSG